MSEEELLKAGISAARAKNITQAAALFAQVVKGNPLSEQGWFLLGMSCSTMDQREYCLRRVLAINPNNKEATAQLASLIRLPAEPVPSRLSQSSGYTPNPSNSALAHSALQNEKWENNISLTPVSYEKISDSKVHIPDKSRTRMSSAAVDEIVEREMQEKRQQLNPDSSAAQLTLGAMGGCLAAVVGAVVWAMIAYITGFQFSIVAIGVGLLVGLTVKMFNQNGGIPSSIIAAVLALFGCLLGNYLAISVLIAVGAEVPIIEVVLNLIFRPDILSEVAGDMFGAKVFLFYIIAMGASFRTSV